MFRDKACIVGIGETKYCRKPGSGMSEEALQLRASVAALQDAGLTGREIDGILAFPNVGKSEAFAASLGVIWRLPTPRYDRFTRPCSINCSLTQLARLLGMAKPTPW